MCCSRRWPGSCRPWPPTWAASAGSSRTAKTAAWSAQAMSVSWGEPWNGCYRTLGCSSGLPRKAAGRSKSATALYGGWKRFVGSMISSCKPELEPLTSDRAAIRDGGLAAAPRDFRAWLVDCDGTLYDARWVRLAMAAELLL